jgi:hypothetical protein
MSARPPQLQERATEVTASPTGTKLHASAKAWKLPQDASDCSPPSRPQPPTSPVNANFNQLHKCESASLTGQLRGEQVADEWLHGREIREVREWECHHVFDNNALVYYFKPFVMGNDQLLMGIYRCTAAMAWWCTSRQVLTV